MRIYPDDEGEQDDEEDVEAQKGGEIILRKGKERLGWNILRREKKG